MIYLFRRNFYLALAALLPLTLTGSVPHAGSSVLASGKWYKLAVTRSGIHRITFSDLNRLGIDLSQLDAGTIRLFGNGSGMLPENTTAARTDDLREVAILVEDGGDARIDEGDDVLFYGEAADKWSYDKLTRLWSHQRNLYSDSTYYFLNVGVAPGKRVAVLPEITDPPGRYSSTYDYYLAQDSDLQNLIRSGREWYGETFNNEKNSYEFPYYFPDIDTITAARIKWFVAAHSNSASTFYLTRSGTVIDSVKVEAILSSDLTRAARAKNKLTTVPRPDPGLSLTLSYNMPNSSSKGWLNYFELMFRRYLTWPGMQFAFRDSYSTGTGRITEFLVRNAVGGLKVWDVTDPSSTGELTTMLSDGTLTFRQYTDSLREFVAFDHASLLPVTLCGEVPNQNLHACQPAELVIVSHPLFLQQAEELGEFHREHNGLTVLVAASDQVFNEFSCGQPDPTAIRDFMKMLWDRDGGALPKYLLLFGDGSYDPKNRIPGNNNMIPTFQSTESLNTTASYVTDDYFGIMADNSGQESNGIIDLGIGRFPVSTPEEARIVLDKIIHYSSSDSPVRGPWRNTVTFVADDENSNLHLHQAEGLTAIVDQKYPVFNVSKIYLDAYKILQIPGGLRFPDANRALNDAVAKGSLIVNYTGHGGETGWSYEQVLHTTDILSWTNKDKLPVFVTATCEFSRFDNPERFTAGEMLILQPDKGAIALYSTTRLAFAGLNILLNTSFVNHLMDKDDDGSFIKMGDMIRLSKNDNNNNFQLRNFVLLGDPAQSIAFPPFNVKTTGINGMSPEQADTVTGMSTVAVTGQIEDVNGVKITSFNGTVNCKVFDKPVTYTTLGNRPENNESYPENFRMQDVLLFNGDVPVESGGFRFSFVMPKGISLQYGNGKLSYYATSANAEASGYSDAIIIGGRNESIDPENPGPAISLYLNDRSFISGGETGSAPVLIADLSDTNGINCTGLGIGHEIVAVLDNDLAHSMVLNDYYLPEFNSYTRGTVTFPLSGLAPGRHLLTLKAWDMYDNSATEDIEFYIPANPVLVVKGVLNAPNPMTDHTDFIFQPHQFDCAGLDVQIRIYNLRGEQVRILTESYNEPVGSSMKIPWDGTGSNGKKLACGIYPYRIIFRAKDGACTETSQKLMIE